MEIKVLGTGCQKCKTLEKITREVVREMGISADISKEEDIVNIMNYGILHTPALVIDGRVMFSGRVPSSKEITEIIRKTL
jgi:small redox-active disulfide protein 2